MGYGYVLIDHKHRFMAPMLFDHNGIELEKGMYSIMVESDKPIPIVTTKRVQ